MGIVRFSSDDPNELPWTTTKRDVDESNAVYRRALVRMREATRDWIDYTSSRRRNLEEAKRVEAAALAKPIELLESQSRMLLPEIAEEEPRVRVVSIQYEKTDNEVRRVAESLGDASMSNAEVGRQTFEYYVESELVD